MSLTDYFSLKAALRFSLYLAIVACSQPALETYGCACASRSYSVTEIAGYRAGAAKNDLKSLAEMQEYHEWRAEDNSVGSADYNREAKLGRNYLDRRLALNDLDALESEIGENVYNAAFRKMSLNDREKLLIIAKTYAKRHGGPITLIDVWDDNRKDIDAIVLIDRQLAVLHKEKHADGS